MPHGTFVTHVPWCMSGSLTRDGGENVPGIPGACATRNFAYLVRGPCGVISYSARPCDIYCKAWWMFHYSWRAPPISFYVYRRRARVDGSAVLSASKIGCWPDIGNTEPSFNLWHNVLIQYFQINSNCYRGLIAENHDIVWFRVSLKRRWMNQIPCNFISYILQQVGLTQPLHVLVRDWYTSILISQNMYWYPGWMLPLHNRWATHRNVSLLQDA